MIKQEQEVYVSREHKQSRFDKRLILKIVKEVENGLPRKEVVRIYGLGKSTLDNWMNKFGSLDYQENMKRRSYSNLQKRTIVTAIEQGRLTIKDAKTAYNVRNEKTIRGWLDQYKSEKVEICIEKTISMAKKNPLSEDIEKEALQKALQDAELKIKALNTLIDVAEEQ
ncbi:MAG: transposase, partial [Flavobacteriales bacterium]|nr:transposase [Flavobacteriales bacterium]